MTQKFYAHSVDGRPTDKWQPLDEHLANVAELAGKFADEFGAGEWAYLAGLWHDLGKYSEEFQQRLHGGSRVDNLWNVALIARTFADVFDSGGYGHIVRIKENR